MLARLKVDPARAAAFEADFVETARAVRANEPDVIVYHLARIRETESDYRVVEIYRSEEAFKAHLATDHFQAFRPKMAAAILAPPEVERLDIVA